MLALIQMVGGDSFTHMDLESKGSLGTENKQVIQGEYVVKYHTNK